MGLGRRGVRPPCPGAVKTTEFSWVRLKAPMGLFSAREMGGTQLAGGKGADELSPTKGLERQKEWAEKRLGYMARAPSLRWGTGPSRQGPVVALETPLLGEPRPRLRLSFVTWGFT